MELLTIQSVLNLIESAAFAVKDGKILAVNPQGVQRRVAVGGEISKLLATGIQEYAEFTGGELSVTVALGSQRCGATVRKIEDVDIFRLEPLCQQERFQTMALIAEILRSPLSGIMPIADQILVGEYADLEKGIQKINQGLYEILRMVNHMSDASQPQGIERIMKTRNIGEFIGEIMEKSAVLLESADLSLEYHGLNTPVYSLIHEQLLEQAIYDLLSNAAKFSPPGGVITVKLTHQRDRLYLTVEDQGSGIPDNVTGRIFSMYRREAGIEDGRYGLGLGISLAHQVAAAHGGTLLIEKSESGGTKVTMTLTIRKPIGAPLRSTGPVVDTTGGWDPALVGLSDVLPSEAFRK